MKSIYARYGVWTRQVERIDLMLSNTYRQNLTRMEACSPTHCNRIRNNRLHLRTCLCRIIIVRAVHRRRERPGCGERRRPEGKAVVLREGKLARACEEDRCGDDREEGHRTALVSSPIKTRGTASNSDLIEAAMMSYLYEHSRGQARRSRQRAPCMEDTIREPNLFAHHRRP